MDGAAGVFGRQLFEAGSELFGSELDIDLGRCDEVVIPVRVRGCASLRRKDDHVVVINLRDQRNLAKLAALGANGVKDHHRSVTELGNFSSVGSELGNDLLVPIALSQSVDPAYGRFPGDFATKPVATRSVLSPTDVGAPLGAEFDGFDGDGEFCEEVGDGIDPDAGAGGNTEVAIL